MTLEGSICPKTCGSTLNMINGHSAFHLDTSRLVQTVIESIEYHSLTLPQGSFVHRHVTQDTMVVWAGLIDFTHPCHGRPLENLSYVALLSLLLLFLLGGLCRSSSTAAVVGSTAAARGHKGSEFSQQVGGDLIHINLTFIFGGILGQGTW